MNYNSHYFLLLKKLKYKFHKILDFIYESNIRSAMTTLFPPETILIGQDIALAQASYPKITIRVAKRDGDYLPCTCECQVNRVNVATEKNIITEIINYG